MKKDKKLAMEIASRMGALHTDNFGDSLVATARFYQRMTGEDLGIEELEKTNRAVKRGKLPWYKRLFSWTPTHPKKK